MQTPNPAHRKGRSKLSLTKTQPRKGNEVSAAAKPARVETMPFKQGMEVLAKAFPSAQSLVITTMPRGGLQIAQPARVPESLLRAYARQFHLEDKLTWQAITSGKAVKALDLLNEDHPFITDYLRSSGLSYAAAAPLRSPVIEGYDGAIHVYRPAEDGPFNAEDLRKLSAAAEEINEIVEKARETRKGTGDDRQFALTPRPSARLFAFDRHGRPQLNADEYVKFDARLREEIENQVKVRIGRLDGQLMTSDRVQLADSRGDLWTFRVVVYSSYPGLADEQIVLFAMQPSCSEWATVRPADLQADAEISRLIPALKFMRQEFHRGPTLGEIAKQVHLSPFHFHRRFAELLGLTPKHYLLECQITEAKAQLLSGKKELAQIAADCGFAHQSHFTSRFKQATGLTPTRWRRLARDTRP